MLPTAIAVEVLPALSCATFAGWIDAARPLRLRLQGEPLRNDALAAMITHAQRAGCAVRVVTDGRRLDDRRARELLDAAPSVLAISLDADASERSIHNVERFVAMRDALRHGAPEVELVATITDAAPAIVELAAERLQGVEPLFLPPHGGGWPPAAEGLRALAGRLGLRRTVRSLGPRRGRAALLISAGGELRACELGPSSGLFDLDLLRGLVPCVHCPVEGRRGDRLRGLLRRLASGAAQASELHEAADGDDRRP